MYKIIYPKWNVSEKRVKENLESIENRETRVKKKGRESKRSTPQLGSNGPPFSVFIWCWWSQPSWIHQVCDNFYSLSLFYLTMQGLRMWWMITWSQPHADFHKIFRLNDQSLDHSTMVYSCDEVIQAMISPTFDF